MKIAFKLALRNIFSAGLRTWLNVGVLSLTIVLMVFYSAYLLGWQKQGAKDAIEWEYGYGQLLHMDYDRYDPFTIEDANAHLPEKEQSNLVPILIKQGTLYPSGRTIPIIIKGIDPSQTTIKLPTSLLKKKNSAIPALIGTRMGESAKLKKGDQVLMRWRDMNGTYDASNITIVGVFQSNVASIDAGQIWLPIERLQEMTDLDGNATLWVANNDYQPHEVPGWRFENQDILLADFNAMVQVESISAAFLMTILLLISLLAIFDTQVLSIFRRQKEIDTYIALGMTRMQVVNLFTIEGSMYSILAIIAGLIYGIPIFIYTAIAGISFPADVTDDLGVQMAEITYPAYSLELMAGIFAIVILASAIISFLPARKIAKLNPVNALKGKLS